MTAVVHYAEIGLKGGYRLPSLDFSETKNCAQFCATPVLAGTWHGKQHGQSFLIQSLSHYFMRVRSSSIRSLAIAFHVRQSLLCIVACRVHNSSPVLASVTFR